LVLALSGAVTAPVFYFLIGAAALTAVSLSAIILGFMSMILANARPYVSPEACQMLLKTGMENTSALIEELGLSNKAVYLPSSARGGHSQALVPLSSNGHLQRTSGKIPGRLIIRYGPELEEMAIAITTAGSVNLDLLPNKPGPTASDIESSLNYILTGVLDIADATSVSVSDSIVKIEVTRPKLASEDNWYYRCLGSPIASIAASVSSEALDKPVQIKEESSTKGKSTITLEILS
jgi:hypothetical protein